MKYFQDINLKLCILFYFIIFSIKLVTSISVVKNIIQIDDIEKRECDVIDFNSDNIMDCSRSSLPPNTLTFETAFNSSIWMHSYLMPKEIGINCIRIKDITKNIYTGYIKISYYLKSTHSNFALKYWNENNKLVVNRLKCDNLNAWNRWSSDRIRFDVNKDIELIIHQDERDSILIGTIAFCNENNNDNNHHNQEFLQEKCQLLTYDMDDENQNSIDMEMTKRITTKNPDIFFVPEWPPITDHLFNPFPTVIANEPFINVPNHQSAWLVVGIIFIILTGCTLGILIVLVVTLPPAIATWKIPRPSHHA